MSPDYGTWTDQLGRDHDADVIARDGDQLVVEIDNQCPRSINASELH